MIPVKKKKKRENSWKIIEEEEERNEKEKVKVRRKLKQVMREINKKQAKLVSRREEEISLTLRE